MCFQELRNKIEETHPEFDIERLQRIYNFSEGVHRGQKRKTGHPFITHPLGVANILYEADGTEDMICVALLHDVVEDADISIRDLTDLFGKRIAKLVELLSKEKCWRTSYCRVKSNLNEIKDVWEEYPEAIVVKMADRLHNIQTLGGFSSSQKNRNILWKQKKFFFLFFVKHSKEKISNRM